MVDDFEFVSEEFDPATNEYVLTFNCSEETVEILKKIYGEDYERNFSKVFNDYIRSLRDETSRENRENTRIDY